MGFREDDEWMQLRGEAICYMNNLYENAFKQFADKVGLKDTFAYDYNYSENKFTIYTSRPGVWIGLHGKNVKILQHILSKEIKEGCEVEFKEIKGKFLVID